MSKKLIIILLGLFPFFGMAQETVHIIPQPVSVSVGKGYFSIDRNTSLNYNSKLKDLATVAGFLNAYIKDLSGFSLPLNTQKSRSIILEIRKTEKIGDEGYLLNISPNTIKITANKKAGIIYGLQTLFQTLPQIRTNATLEVPVMKITDYPRFKWRGMHLDVSRHFFSPEMIKEYIDLMLAYKFNTFHWHLTDAQGWRLEIKKYPKLTSVGAWRPDRRGIPWREIQPSKEDEPKTYGGYYTQQQVKDIVKYAKERNVTIVPEIEMPGHSAAALAAYPDLSCTQQPQMVPVARAYPESENNYCAGNDSVFIFLENVLTEVMQLFPSEYIHVGGDEVKKISWENCARCQERIKAENLKDEDELQSYFIRRIGKFLTTHNRKLLGWDEIMEGGLAPGAAVMSWRGEKGGIKAAKMHHNVVMTPANPLYFDFYQRGTVGEPLAIGGLNTAKMVYEYDPVPEELSREEAKYILGAQANVWAEFISTVSHLEYMILPRMLALAEAVWSPKDAKDWNKFYDKLAHHFTEFEQKGLNYSNVNNIAIRSSAKKGKIEVSLASDIPGADMYYTTDGTEPTVQCHKYEQPFLIESPAIVKAVAVIDGKVIDTNGAEKRFEAK